MLAQLEKPHHDFAALAAYLIYGDTRPTPPSRVAWTMARNLPTDDPMLAAGIMSATAELSRRCTNACYHAIIAWAEYERPSPEIMQEIAIKTLGMAGLAEHQALIMGHGDKAHPHLHMMINRVHSESGRAWSTSHDYRRFDRIMRQLSDEYGFEYVPPHSFHPELTDDLPKGPNSRATYAAKRGANTTRRQWARSRSQALGATLSARLDHATTWQDVEHAFADEGLNLEAKGTGFVAGDATSYSKLSAFGLTTTAKNLTRTFAKRYVPAAKRSPRRARAAPAGIARRPVFSVDAIDVARAIGGRADVSHAVQEAVRARKARLARKPLMEQLMEELRERWRSSSSLRGASARKRPNVARSRTRARGRNER